MQEYLGITGNPVFNELSAKLAFGESSTVIREKRNATVQALSGTGSLRVSRAHAHSSALPFRGRLCLSSVLTFCEASEHDDEGKSSHTTRRLYNTCRYCCGSVLEPLLMPCQVIVMAQVGAEFLAQHYPVHTVLLPNPTWANHNKIFPLAGIKDVRKYRYFKPATKGLDYEVCNITCLLTLNFPLHESAKLGRRRCNAM